MKASSPTNSCVLHMALYQFYFTYLPTCNECNSLHATPLTYVDDDDACDDDACDDHADDDVDDGALSVVR